MNKNKNLSKICDETAVKYLIGNNTLNAKELSDKAHCSRDKARKTLTALAERGIAEKCEKLRSGYVYRISSKLRCAVVDVRGSKPEVYIYSPSDDTFKKVFVGAKQKRNPKPASDIAYDFIFSYLDDVLKDFHLHSVLFLSNDEKKLPAELKIPENADCDFALTSDLIAGFIRSTTEYRRCAVIYSTECIKRIFIINEGKTETSANGEILFTRAGGDSVKFFSDASVLIAEMFSPDAVFIMCDGTDPDQKEEISKHFASEFKGNTDMLISDSPEQIILRLAFGEAVNSII